MSELSDSIIRNSHELSFEDAERIITFLEGKIGIGSGASGAQSGETVVANLLLENFPGELVIFDVGANKGQYCKIMRTALERQRDYEIHCFEPSQAAFLELQQNTPQEPYLYLNHFGLSDSAGTATLYMDKKTSGLASLTARRLDHFGIHHAQVQETVRLSTLDDYCSEMAIERINLLKIDVEGHELDVIKGGKNAFAQGMIDLVQFEFGGCNIDTRTFFQDYFYFFNEAGYDLYRILPDNTLSKIPYYTESYEKFRTTNYLAAARG